MNADQADKVKVTEPKIKSGDSCTKLNPKLNSWLDTKLSKCGLKTNTFSGKKTSPITVISSNYDDDSWQIDTNYDALQSCRTSSNSTQNLLLPPFSQATNHNAASQRESETSYSAYG